MRSDLLKGKVIDLKLQKKKNEEILALLQGQGVSEIDIQNVEYSREFIDAITRRHIARCLDREGAIWDALVTKATCGNVNAAKLYFDLTGRLEKRQEHKREEKDYSNMSEEELDAQLASRN